MNASRRGTRTLSLIGSLLSTAACSGKAPSLIQVRQTVAPAALISYRDGAGPWTTPSLNDRNGTYDLWAVDDFEFVGVVVLGDGTFEAERLLATVDDGTCWFYGPPFALDPSECSTLVAPPSIVHVSGQVAQTGWVSIGSQSARGVGQWSYDLAATTGVHDVIVVTQQLGGTAYAAIHRGRDFEVDTVEPTIDVFAEGARLELLPISVAGIDADGDLESTVTLRTENDSATISTNVQAPSASAVVAVLPRTLSTPSDRQTLELVSTSSSARKQATILLDGSPPNASLISLPPVSYAPDYATASWTKISSKEQGASLALYAGLSFQRVSATERWLDAHTHTIASQSDVPGYLPTWDIAATPPFSADFEVWAEDGATRYSAIQTSSGLQ